LGGCFSPVAAEASHRFRLSPNVRTSFACLEIFSRSSALIRSNFIGVARRATATLMGWII
jgi:hypothetical protein